MQDITYFLKPAIKLILFPLQRFYFLFDFDLHHSIFLIFFLDSGINFTLKNTVFLFSGSEHHLGRLNSTFQLTNILFNFLQLLLFGNKLRSNKIEVVSSFILFHNLEHELQVLTEFLIVFANPKLFLIFMDFNFDAFFCQWD